MRRFLAVAAASTVLALTACEPAPPVVQQMFPDAPAGLEPDLRAQPAPGDPGYPFGCGVVDSYRCWSIRNGHGDPDDPPGMGGQR